MIKRVLLSLGLGLSLFSIYGDNDISLTKKQEQEIKELVNTYILPKKSYRTLFRLKMYKTKKLVTSLIGNKIRSSNTLTEFEKFTKRFAPPEHLQKVIENNKDVINQLNRARQFGIIRDTSGNPVLYVKNGDINRIINAERIREFIRIHDLDHLIRVPKKYLYNIDGKWIVFAEYVDYESTNYTFDHIKALIMLSELTCYADCHKGNCTIDKTTGKLVVIDTEDRSFNHCYQKAANQLNYLEQFISFKVFKYSLRGACGFSLLCTTDFDPVDIDFKQIKLEYNNNIPNFSCCDVY